MLADISLAQGADIQWQHLSSKNGDLSVPGESTEQTGSLIADLDHDGVKDFVICFRKKAPALVWYRRWSSSYLEWRFLEPE